MARSLIRFYRSVMVQDAVYWGSARHDSLGTIYFDDPVAVKVRWDETPKLVFNFRSEQVVAKASIMVDIKMELEGYLWLGSIDDLSEEQKDDPNRIGNAYQIIGVSNIPLFRSSTDFIREVYV